MKVSHLVSPNLLDILTIVKEHANWTKIFGHFTLGIISFFKGNIRQFESLLNDRYQVNLMKMEHIVDPSNSIECQKESIECPYLLSVICPVINKKHRWNIGNTQMAVSIENTMTLATAIEMWLS
jgi:hypothetical protein